MASPESSKHFSSIDAGISDLWSLSLPAHLESLNLHGNLIHCITNLSHLRTLTHLDLSANQITIIEGLDQLYLLKTLNLSCNQIRTIGGLSNLRSLEHLNLSFNEVEDLSGISALLKVNEGRLSYLALHGNNLCDLQKLIFDLRDCSGLCHLILSQDDSQNPLCNNIDYIEEIQKGLPQLSTLNEQDRSGRIIALNEFIYNIPELESYLDYLLSSDVNEQLHPSKKPLEEGRPATTASQLLVTPKIDAMMTKFKELQCLQTLSCSTSPFLQSDHDHLSSISSPTSNLAGYSDRTKKIFSDSQSSLTQLSPSSKRRTRQKDGVNFDIADGDDSDDDIEPVHDKERAYFKLHSFINRQPTHKTSTYKISSRQRERNVGDQRSNQKQNLKPAANKTRLAGKADQLRVLNSSSSDPRPGLRSDGDQRKRLEFEADYKDLLGTLESERKRRWKAEQAVCKLADILKTVNAKHQSTEDMKISALEDNNQLKQTVLNEHETNQRLGQEVDHLKSDLQKTRDQLDFALRSDQLNQEAVKEAEATFARKEGQIMAERIHQAKKLQEAQQKALSKARETDILRHALDTSKVKVEQLQETLASREQQHRDEMRNTYHLNSPKFQEMLGVKVKQMQQQNQTELVKQQERVEQLSKQYSDLEEEFRQALTLEDKRFEEVSSELQAIRLERDECQQLLLTAQRKDQTSNNIITELSELVREQKGRIKELVTAKQELTLSHKERVQALEEWLEKSRCQVSRLDAAKQTWSKLQATVQAQESVIEGLKAERKLWGQELAQQGASLAKDRGRLDAKIETLNSENSTLNKQLEREKDAVKIKTKMIEDQSETIRKLKEALSERDETVRATREESMSVQRSLEDQMAEMKTALDDCRVAMERALSRKEELKRQVASLEEELAESKISHCSLNSKWREKSELIDQLEQQVTHMQNNWTQKEAKLTAERDTALKQAKEAFDKLKSVDLAFRQQLDVKEASLQTHIHRLEAEKQQEIELANQKVALVEEEMRDMLRDNEANKRAMEAKLQRLTQALGDLQTDLL